MYSSLAPRGCRHVPAQPFLGRKLPPGPDSSDALARDIDNEIRRIVESAHQRAKDILTEYREQLVTISEILVKRETIEKDEFEALLAGKTEEDVFGPDEPAGIDSSGTPEAAAGSESPGRQAGPRPL